MTLNSLIKKVLNVNTITVQNVDMFEDSNCVQHLEITVRPHKGHEDFCPVCHRRCPRYDNHGHELRSWRALDWGGIVVNILADTHRICCPEHGVLVADVPWAYPGSGFTKDFDKSVAWLATGLSKSAVSEYMRIDWKTVGRCITRSLNDIEPDRKRRLEGLVNIGIDETSYRKGHKYITIVVNQDTNCVVWIGAGHGKKVLEKFFKLLTPEQCQAIKTVTGDGARWITDCAVTYCPQAERCVDAFHVVEWATEELGKVRVNAWRGALDEAKQLEEEQKAQADAAKAAADAAAAAAEEAAKTAAEEADEAERRAKDLEAQAEGFKDAKAAARAAKKAAKREAAKAAKRAQKAKEKAVAARKKASQIKGSSYALGKNPEHLTNTQQVTLEMISLSQKQLARAYRLKEELRLLLKMNDPDAAAAALKKWEWRASHSRIPEFHELYEKIRRNQTFIINTIRLGFSNARIEAMNNKIDVIIRQAYGFRNLENMFNMIYLICSDLKIELPNRGKPKVRKREKPEARAA